MKKIVALLALGALLVGFSFTQINQPTDSAMDVEPSILSIQQPVNSF